METQLVSERDDVWRLDLVSGSSSSTQNIPIVLTSPIRTNDTLQSQYNVFHKVLTPVATPLFTSPAHFTQTSPSVYHLVSPTHKIKSSLFLHPGHWQLSSTQSSPAVNINRPLLQKSPINSVTSNCNTPPPTPIRVKMPPKRRRPTSRIKANAKWDQIYNSSVTILVFSGINAILSVLDHLFESGQEPIWFPLMFIASALYNAFVATIAIWVFRKGQYASKGSIILTFFLSLVCTVSSIALAFVSSLALAQRNGTFDFVRTGVVQRRYYKSSAQQCGDQCTRNWLVLMLISCGFFVNGAVSIYLSAILKSQWLHARVNKKTPTIITSQAKQSNGRSPLMPGDAQKHMNGHVSNGGIVGKESQGVKRKHRLVVAKKSKGKRAVQVTTNPYVGFQLGNLITEEYVMTTALTSANLQQDSPMNASISPPSTLISNFSPIGRKLIVPRPQHLSPLSIAHPTASPMASTSFFNNHAHFCSSSFTQPADYFIPRLTSNSSESLPAFPESNSRPDFDDEADDLQVFDNYSAQTSLAAPAATSFILGDDTLIDFNTPPGSTMGSEYSAFSPLGSAKSRRVGRGHSLQRVSRQRMSRRDDSCSSMSDNEAAITKNNSHE